jgi:hypothetical protein
MHKRSSSEMDLQPQYSHTYATYTLVKCWNKTSPINKQTYDTIYIIYNQTKVNFISPNHNFAWVLQQICKLGICKLDDLHI